jgi:hypothetical protein
MMMSRMRNGVKRLLKEMRPIIMPKINPLAMWEGVVPERRSFANLTISLKNIIHTWTFFKVKEIEIAYLHAG